VSKIDLQSCSGAGRRDVLRRVETTLEDRGIERDDDCAGIQQVNDTAGDPSGALRRARWLEAPSLAFAALLAVLPAAQIDVSWAICFPHGVAAVAGPGGFPVIRPAPRDTLTPLRFEDEFGSLSSDSDWVPCAACAICGRTETQFSVACDARGWEIDATAGAPTRPRCASSPRSTRPKSRRRPHRGCGFVRIRASRVHKLVKGRGPGEGVGSLFPHPFAITRGTWS